MSDRETERESTEQRAPSAHDRELVEGLLGAYRVGAFPMNDPRTGRIGFFDPDPRAILPLGETGEERFRVPRRLARVMRRTALVFTTDEAFGEVIRACARPRVETERSEAVSAETWIDGRIVRAYEALHRAGHAHSVEAWRVRTDGSRALVGGIYGVHLGGLFAGESMFHDADAGGTDAGKMCLVRLVGHLRRCGFALFDVQFANPLLERFGCVEIPRSAYMERLGRALAVRASWRSLNDEPGGLATGS